MSDEPDKITAVFRVTKTHVSITAKYLRGTLQLTWKRDEDDDETTRQVNALLANLPAMVREGIQEVQVKAAMEDIDQEYRDLFPREDGDDSE